MGENEQANGLTALARVNEALAQCREAGRSLVCILCRPAFFAELMKESSDLSTEAVRIGVQELGDAKTVFGVRITVTADVADDVNLFEVLV